MYPQPPPWLIVAALIALALPASVVGGLIAAALFDRWSRTCVAPDISARDES